MAARAGSPVSEAEDKVRLARAERRSRLADDQAALVSALVADGSADGFDPARVEATARALLRKRTRALARLWPALATGLDAELEPRFEAYAAGNPPPADGGALADGLRFARELRRAGELCDEARVELLLVEANLRLRRGRLTRRRVFAGAARTQWRWVLAVRLPEAGVRTFTVRRRRAGWQPEERWAGTRGSRAGAPRRRRPPGRRRPEATPEGQAHSHVPPRIG